MGNRDIKISIIMASYNYENFIKEAIESVINQTYPNWELIIVDDGSTDNSIEVIKKYVEQDSRIKFFQHEKEVNKGLKETILLGIDKASYEWISFLESDDIFKPNCLEEKVKVIEQKPEVNFIFSDVEFFGDKKRIIEYNPYLKKREELLNQKIKYTDLLKLNIVPTFSCVLLKKELLINCDFNCKTPQLLDLFLWLQLFKKTPVFYLTKKLTSWRIHPHSYINKLEQDDEVRLAKQVLDMFKKGIIAKILTQIYFFINQRNIEKIFRPQVKMINNLIFDNLKIKNDFVNIIKV